MQGDESVFNTSDLFGCQKRLSIVRVVVDRGGGGGGWRAQQAPPPPPLYILIEYVFIHFFNQNASK